MHNQTFAPLIHTNNMFNVFLMREWLWTSQVLWMRIVKTDMRRKVWGAEEACVVDTGPAKSRCLRPMGNWQTPTHTNPTSGSDVCIAKPSFGSSAKARNVCKLQQPLLSPPSLYPQTASLQTLANPPYHSLLMLHIVNTQSPPDPGFSVHVSLYLPCPHSSTAPIQGSRTRTEQQRT